MREEVEVLEHHADLAPDLVDALEVVGELDAVDDDLAGLMLLEPVDAADHRRLARARGPADHDALAAHHLEVDVLQHVEIAVPFVHVDDLDRDVGRSACASTCGSSSSGHDVLVLMALPPHRLWPVSSRRSV